MRKRGKKLVAMALATSMALSTVSMQAFADETKTATSSNAVQNEDGTTTNQEITTTTTTDENGNVIVEVKVTEGIISGTNNDGATVEGTMSETKVTDNTTDPGKTTVDGTETKEWTEDAEPGQDIPEVNVTIQKDENGNIVLSGSATGTPSEKETDHLEAEGGSTENKSNITTTTTTTTTTVTGTGTIKESFVINGKESELECPVAPEDYDDKGYYDGYQEGENKYYRDGLLDPDSYTEDAHAGLVDPKPDGEGYEKGFDLTWTGYGDTTDGGVAVWVDELVYLVDEETGEIVYENGFPVVDMEKTKFICGKNGKQINSEEKGGYGQATGMVSQSVQFALRHENGEFFYAYCMDASTGAGPTGNRWYNIRNIEDAIESEENPDGYLTEDEAAQIRAIATNGYWGTEEGRGSVESLKELLKATYNENSKINVRYPGSNEPHEFDIYELIDGLTEYEALAVTQAAIWTYANKGDVTYDQGGNGGVVTGGSVIGVLSAHKFQNSSGGWLNEYMPAKDGESDARMQALYQCLLSLKPIYADGELREDSFVIPNEGAIEEMAMVIKDKVEDEAANFDDNTDNDVFNTEVNFKLAFVPGDNDEMYVCLMDANNQPIKDENGQPIRKLLASETSTKDGDNVIRPVNGVYTLSGLKVSENFDFVFDLKLEGTQYLNEGVYIYQAEGGRKESQTLVGLAKGEQKVQVSTVMTINFNVDEENHVVAEREWHEEETTTPDNGGGNDDGGDNGGNGGGSTPSDPNPVTPQVAAETFEIEESEVPLSDGVSVLGAFEIDDDMIPLGVLPATGDNSLWLMIVSLFSGLSLAGASFVDKMKKRRR